MEGNRRNSRNGTRTSEMSNATAASMEMLRAAGNTPIFSPDREDPSGMDVDEDDERFGPAFEEYLINMQDDDDSLPSGPVVRRKRRNWRRSGSGRVSHATEEPSGGSSFGNGEGDSDVNSSRIDPAALRHVLEKQTSDQEDESFYKPGRVRRRLRIPGSRRKSAVQESSNASCSPEPSGYLESDNSVFDQSALTRQIQNAEDDSFVPNVRLRKQAKPAKNRSAASSDSHQFGGQVDTSGSGIDGAALQRVLAERNSSSSSFFTPGVVRLKRTGKVSESSLEASKTNPNDEQGSSSGSGIDPDAIAMALNGNGTSDYSPKGVVRLRRKGKVSESGLEASNNNGSEKQLSSSGSRIDPDALAMALNGNNTSDYSPKGVVRLRRKGKVSESGLEASNNNGSEKLLSSSGSRIDPDALAMAMSGDSSSSYSALGIVRLRKNEKFAERSLETSKNGGRGKQPSSSGIDPDAQAMIMNRNASAQSHGHKYSNRLPDEECLGISRTTSRNRVERISSSQHSTTSQDNFTSPKISLLGRHPRIPTHGMKNESPNIPARSSENSRPAVERVTPSDSSEHQAAASFHEFVINDILEANQYGGRAKGQNERTVFQSPAASLDEDLQNIVDATTFHSNHSTANDVTEVLESDLFTDDEDELNANNPCRTKSAKSKNETLLNHISLASEVFSPNNLHVESLFENSDQEMLDQSGTLSDFSVLMDETRENLHQQKSETFNRESVASSKRISRNIDIASNDSPETSKGTAIIQDPTMPELSVPEVVLPVPGASSSRDGLEKSSEQSSRPCARRKLFDDKLVQLEDLSDLNQLPATLQPAGEKEGISTGSAVQAPSPPDTQRVSIRVLGSEEEISPRDRFFNLLQAALAKQKSDGLPAVPYKNLHDSSKFCLSLPRELPDSKRCIDFIQPKVILDRDETDRLVAEYRRSANERLELEALESNSMDDVQDNEIEVSLDEVENSDDQRENVAASGPDLDMEDRNEDDEMASLYSDLNAEPESPQHYDIEEDPEASDIDEEMSHTVTVPADKRNYEFGDHLREVSVAKPVDSQRAKSFDFSSSSDSSESEEAGSENSHRSQEKETVDGNAADPHTQFNSSFQGEFDYGSRIPENSHNFNAGTPRNRSLRNAHEDSNAKAVGSRRFNGYDHSGSKSYQSEAEGNGRKQSTSEEKTSKHNDARTEFINTSQRRSHGRSLISNNSASSSASTNTYKKKRASSNRTSGNTRTSDSPRFNESSGSSDSSLSDHGGNQRKPNGHLTLEETGGDNDARADFSPRSPRKSYVSRPSNKTNVDGSLQQKKRMRSDPQPGSSKANDTSYTKHDGASAKPSRKRKKGAEMETTKTTSAQKFIRKSDVRDCLAVKMITIRKTEFEKLYSDMNNAFNYFLLRLSAKGPSGAFSGEDLRKELAFLSLINPNDPKAVELLWLEHFGKQGYQAAEPYLFSRN